MTDARFDIWPVLEHYGWELPAPRGVWQTVKCGAHDDSHQSCRISHDAGRVKCMACDFQGDAIDVVQHYEGIGYRDAVTRCETITGGSSASVRDTGRRYSPVSRGTRDQSRKRKYVPPRARNRADHRP